MFRSFKILKTPALALTAAALLALPVFAGEPSAETIPEGVIDRDGVELVVDGFAYEGEIFTLNDTAAYVSLREFSCMADNAVVSWDAQSEEALVATDSLTLTAASGENYLEANGRVLWCESGIFTLDGTLYVPLQQAARAFGFDADYSEEEGTTRLTRVRGAILPDEEYYDEDDLYWLSKIIHAESGGEPFLGKLAVGAVIRNRVDSDEFPDTIRGVIFDDENGTQFTPIANGAIRQEPGEESVLAAKICLEDYRLSDEILYFLNVRLSTSFWIVENCTYVMTIGGHDFYSD